MGEHPPVSLVPAPTALENIQPLAGAGPPSTARSSAPANFPISRNYSTDPNSSSTSQHPSLRQDPSFRSLIQKTRSSNPSYRPNLMSIVLQLQQVVTRYFLYRSKFPLPAPASLSASLSLYMPRTPVKSPSPMLADDFLEHFTSGTPSPSSPRQPPYPHHPPSHTTKVDLTSFTAYSRPTRVSRSTLVSQVQSPSPLDTASRANRSPTRPILAPAQHTGVEHAPHTGNALTMHLRP